MARSYQDLAKEDIKLPKDKDREAIASIVRYFQEQREEKIGNIAATGLLRFFLAEIGPSIYNQAVADIQQRMQMHVSDLDISDHGEDRGTVGHHHRLGIMAKSIAVASSVRGDCHSLS